MLMLVVGFAIEIQIYTLAFASVKLKKKKKRKENFCKNFSCCLSADKNEMSKGDGSTK